MSKFLGNLSLDRIRSEKIKDFFILNETGHSVYHRAYISSKIDDDLVSGFLSAIFSISKELSIDRIHVMDMQETKFIYETRPPHIFVLNVTKDVDPLFGNTILTQIVNFFEVTFNNLNIKTKPDEWILFEKLKLIDFGSKLDYFINEALLEHYFKTPGKILEEIESFLIGLFGSVGDAIMNLVIKQVCKRKENFKSANLKSLISGIEDQLIRKINLSQAKMIIQQIKGIFLPRSG